jgi:hypothetical protein
MIPSKCRAQSHSYVGNLSEGNQDFLQLHVFPFYIAKIRRLPPQILTLQELL